MRPGSQGMFAPRHSLAACAIALAGLTAAGCRDINVPDPARAPHGALAAKAGIPKPLPLRLDETFRAAPGAPLVVCSPELSVPSRLIAEGVIAPHMGRTKSVLTVLSCEVNDGTPIISVSDSVAGATGDSLSGYWIITISNIKNGKATLELEILFLSGSGWFDNTIGQATGSGVMDVASGAGSYSAAGTISPREDGQAGGPLIAPQTITAGAEFACGLAASGEAYCWGRNQYGQLGDGTTTNRSAPTPVASGIVFKQISAGGSHVCGLTPSRFTYCWGLNDHGQLGTGDVTTHPTPTLVTGGHLFAQISAGFAHTCAAADSTGAAYCWGSNIDATLGDGTRTDRHAPTAVKGGLSIKVVDAGGHHTCALTTTGSAYCWGANQYGQLGDGTTVSHTTPSAVVLEKSYAHISAGLDFTCGIEASSLLAFCWGRDNTYQLGDANQTDRDYPGVVGAGGVHFSRISAGNDHACGVGTDGGAYCWGSAPGNGYSTAQFWPMRLPGSSSHNDTYKQVAAGTNFACGLSSAAVGYCWGSNSSGQLGSGNTSPYAGEPLQVSSDVPGGLRFAMISGGDVNTCGMTSIGAAYCWGANLYGQVGDGTTTERDVPTPVVGGIQFKDLSVGGFHACALRSDGGAMCWGYNSSGELGDGTVDVRTAPTPVAGSLSFAYIRAGGSHTCAIVSGGAVYCWGDNDAGQLGDGTTTDRHAPTLIAGPYAFGVVATGRWHTCALTRDGAAYCWGDYGTGKSNSPVLVPSPEPFISLDAGDKNTCGITRTNAVYCWGSNGSGQIGDGTTDPVEIPKRVMVLNGAPLAQFGVGDDHVCVLTATTGAAFCSGMNLYGQLGDNTTTDRHEPTAVYNPGNRAFERIDGGRDHTCALSNGAAYCWGSNAYGQLGNDDNDKVEQHAPAVVTRLLFKTQ